MTGTRAWVRCAAIWIVTALFGGPATAQVRLGLCAGDDVPASQTTPAVPTRPASDGFASLLAPRMSLPIGPTAEGAIPTTAAPEASEAEAGK